MFDSLIREATSRFNLGDKAGDFVRTLVEAIFDGNSGGFAGLRDRFTRAGLGDLFGSWIGGSPGDNALQPDQFNAGFGSDTIAGIAGKLGLPAASVNVAGASLLPKIVGLLTPGGSIPTALPAGNWFASATQGLGESLRSGAGAAAAGIGAAATGIGGSVRGGAEAVGATAANAGDALRGGVGAAARSVERAGGGWWKWLLGLIVLAILVFLFGLRPYKGEQTAPTDTATANTEAATADTGADASATTGADSADSGAATTDAASADASTTPADADSAGADGAATDTGAASPTVAAAGDDAAGTDASTAPAEDATAANTEAASALDNLKPGGSADDLVKALNLMIIHFDTGSANISGDSQDILGKAAEAIKEMPEGTKIEVGGHTDNTGNATANRSLSQRRADAVVAKLAALGVTAGALSGKGYGQDKPKAGNNTAEGRAENRRIEFTVRQ